MNALQELGVLLIKSLQTLSPALDPLMLFFTFLGRIEGYMLLITFLYWLVNRQLGVRVFLVLLSTDFVSTSLKIILHQPRPYWLGEVKGLTEEPSYGVPSSHASDTFAVWGYLAYYVKKGWFWVTAVILILMIGISRVYLGVHFPHDVIVGWLVGLAMLFLVIRYEDRIPSRLNSYSANAQIGLGFLISILFIATAVIIGALMATIPDPPSWTQFTQEARSPAHYFSLAGAIFGVIAGYVLMKGHARFQTGGTWTQKAGRYILGIISVVIILYGLDALFDLIAADETITGYALRYVRYGLTSFWAMFGAPWLFLKLKLAEPSP
jgi:membrane-associated phospholipid phosphatase